MKKIITALSLVLSLVGGVQAAGGDIQLDKAPDRSKDLGALQNGAKLFVNYCIGCHSAEYLRYNRLRDIGLTEVQIKENLMFTTEKVGDVMKAAIDPRQAKEWFGSNPPDLTLVARSRSSHSGTGADYLYTYLRTYYRDATKPTGWNNLAFPNVGMPHVLWELQGERRPLFETVKVSGQDVQKVKGWEQVTPGKLSPAEYDEAIGDLVGFMQWMAEPIQNTRKTLGVWVLAFLAVFSFIAWKLNAAYWKDIK